MSNKIAASNMETWVVTWSHIEALLTKNPSAEPF
jgi:hypothetical protein